MTLNDLKKELVKNGFVKSGRKYILSGSDYNLSLYMDIAPTLSVHMMMIQVDKMVSNAKSEVMIHISLDSMFDNDRFYIYDTLKLKEEHDPNFARFKDKFSTEYLPVISKLTSVEGIIGIYDQFLYGRGLIAKYLKEDMANFKSDARNN